MNKFLKTGILLVTLAIPVLIWLFLKNFGQNQFALPLYYQEEVPAVPGCKDLKIPHSVSLRDEGQEYSTSSTLVDIVTVSYLLPETCDDNCQLVLEELANLQTLFSDHTNFQILVLGSGAQYTELEVDQLKSQYSANPEFWKFVLIPENQFSSVFNCGFLLTKTKLSIPLVLTDKDAKIRGYYEALDTDEVERLKGELKILFYMLEAHIYD